MGGNSNESLARPENAFVGPAARYDHKLILSLIMLTGFAVRGALLLTPRSYHADEVFQYLEQAHRLVFGYGVVPWEYHYGIRSWLVPTMLSWPMAVGAWLWPGTNAYLIVPRLCLCGLSLGSVMGAYALGRRLSPLHGWAAALAAAFWPEFMLFGGQALTDAIAIPFALGAAALLQSRRTHWTLLMAGASLAFAGAVRFPYVPAFAVLAVLSLGWRWRDGCWFGLGVLLALALASIPDVAMGRPPYGWVLANWHQNVGADHASGYGAEGPFFYANLLVAAWSIWFVPMLWLAWLGGQRYPALLAMAATNIAVHSFIAHKEYRFILLSTMTIVILAAIGTIDVVKRKPGRFWRISLAVGWVAAAITCSAMPAQRQAWARQVSGNRAFAAIGYDTRTCGVAMWELWWTTAGGYTYLHRRVPLYLPEAASNPHQALWRHQAAFNVVLAPAHPTSPLPPTFRRGACFAAQSAKPDQSICIWSRAGPCQERGAEDLSIGHFIAEPGKSK